MATLIEQGNPGNQFSFPILDTYEFIPVVQFKKPSKYTAEGEELIPSEERASLAKYIDDDKRNFNILHLTTSKKMIKLPFTVKKGSSASWDNDGFIEPQLSIKDANFKIISTTKILTKYNSDIEVELSLEGSESTSFYLDFYANDNEDLFKGGIKNIFCGRVKIVFYLLSPKVFSKKELNNYVKYIVFNKSLSGEYGYSDLDKHDCVTAINRSLRKLLKDNSIPAKANMDDQMLKMIDMNYATNQISIDFKDIDGNKTTGISDPYDYLNKTLVENLNENLTDSNGFYFFGMSIMDGYHSVMIVVNKVSASNIKYNAYDQHGSVLGDVNLWYNALTLNEWLLNYVNLGNTTLSGNRGKIITTITQIKHNVENN